MSEMGMVERVARALMEVRAKSPASGDDAQEWPVIALDPDFDDLPLDHTQGTCDDDVTQEAVLRLARAAIGAMREPTDAMRKVAVPAFDNAMYGGVKDGAWQAMVDAALQEPPRAP